MQNAEFGDRGIKLTKEEIDAYKALTSATPEELEAIGCETLAQSRAAARAIFERAIGQVNCFGKKARGVSPFSKN